MAGPSTPTPTQNSNNTIISIEQEQLNNFLGPVNGALGGLPVAERNQSYFIVFQQAGGTGPEIIDETAYFITYLVDENGNVSKPSDDYVSLENLLQNFEVGKNAIVRNDAATAVNGQLVGNKLISGIGKQEPILYSQIGPASGDNIDVLNFNSDLNSIVTPRMEGAMVRGIFAPTPGVGTFQTVTSYNSPVSSPQSQAATFDNTAGTYTVTSAGIGDTNSIFFEVSIGLRLNSTGNDSQTRDTTIRIKRDSTVIGTKTYTIQGTNTGEEATFNFESDPLVVGQLLGFFNTGDPVYTVEIQFEDTIFCTADFIQFRIINQNPEPSNPPVLGNYWDNNSGTSFWLTASAELSTNYGAVQNSQNVLDQIEPGFNFSPVTVPFNVEAGDRIRFEYNKETDYTIYEVIEPSGDIDGKLKLRLNTLIPTSINLDNFVLHRINSNDPAYIILNVAKNASMGNTQNFNGVILPEYPTKKLKDNLDNIIIDLKSRGIITDNEN